jgi:hypothetical protein
MPRPKSAAKRLHCAVAPDLDKLVRGCLDPLKGVVIEDGLPTWRHMLKGCFGRGKPSATYWG